MPTRCRQLTSEQVWGWQAVHADRGGHASCVAHRRPRKPFSHGNHGHANGAHSASLLEDIAHEKYGGNYENVPGSGPLFLEDYQGCGVFRSTAVWARQLNPESCNKIKGVNVTPKLVNDGSTLWILGLKTERPTTIITTRHGGRTEVLGGLIYPVEAVPHNQPAFVNTESSHWLSFVIHAHKPAASHHIIIEETHGGQTRHLTKKQVPPRAQGSMIPLYVGYPEAPSRGRREQPRRE